MGSLSEQERCGLDDVFLSLGEKQLLKDSIKEQHSRFISSLKQIAKKGLPLSISYIKMKKNMLFQGAKRNNFKLFFYIRPKNRGSK
ncbi:hypothetical protein JHD50_00145 [Sulfurimonas sp. MAG313]|nr:hypothetical protein [Sulfurimonas sp. MAG313]MDF1879724.1 hypothetical protein [Sulfurimonas sp. MAG313]